MEEELWNLLASITGISFICILIIEAIRAILQQFVLDRYLSGKR